MAPLRCIISFDGGALASWSVYVCSVRPVRNPQDSVDAAEKTGGGRKKEVEEEEDEDEEEEEEEEEEKEEEEEEASGWIATVASSVALIGSDRGGIQ
ncbi:hypothetical protein M0802_006245 [Mischocyttarus mexicanus]|nr:hypothetical protein M0802_006245 [Mischocyttarus mexicanus]